MLHTITHVPPQGLDVLHTIPYLSNINPNKTAWDGGSIINVNGIDPHYGASRWVRRFTALLEVLPSRVRVRVRLLEVLPSTAWWRVTVSKA